jgi:hypothetical protein
MHHGKTTVAKYLERTHGVRRHRFAGPIKALVVQLLIEAGVRPEHAAIIVEDPEMKNLPISELYGITPRQLMRSIGDIGREIHPEFWASITMTRIRIDHRADPSRVYVIDDWRYPEGEGGRMLAGDVDVTFVRVNRPGVPPAVRDHSSEGGLDDWLYDFIITNRENELAGLHHQADCLLERVLELEAD